MIGGAIHARLTGDGPLASMIDSYLGSPAVFNSDEIPPDPIPYIHIAAPSSDQGIARGLICSDHEVREISLDITVVTSERGTNAGIDAIAERVRDLLHKSGARAGLSGGLSFGAYSGIMTTVTSGPVEAPTDETRQARTITVRAYIGD